MQQGQAVPEDLSARPEGTIEEKRRADEELHNFARKTLKALVKFETMKYNVTPSIALFCRMDIALTCEEDGELHYFVNEVERTGTVSLWSGGSTGRRCAGLVAAEFSTRFPGWLDAQMRRVV